MTTPLDRVKALLAALPRPDQEELTRFLHDILFTPEEVEAAHTATLTETPRAPPDAEPASGEAGAAAPKGAAGRGRKKRGTLTYTYRNEWIKCGKDGCRCMEGERHGPYTYKYWKEGGKLRKAYVGKSGRRGRVRKRKKESEKGASGGPAASAQAP